MTAITLFTVIQGHRFWYQSIERVRLPFRSEPLKPRITKFYIKKLETLLFPLVDADFDILNRLDVDHKCDGGTDRQTELLLAIARSNIFSRALKLCNKPRPSRLYR